MQADKLLTGDGEQVERIGVAQVVLDEEGNLGQLVEGAQVFGVIDARFFQPLRAQGLAAYDVGDRGAQALEL